MTAAFDRFRRRYGQSVTLTPQDGGEALQMRAFLQPILRRREDGGAAVTPLGGVDEERWLYLGPGGTEVALGDRVDYRELELVVQQARPVFAEDTLVYWWATLRRRKGGGNEQRH